MGERSINELCGELLEKRALIEAGGGQKAVDFYKAFGVKYITVPYYQPEHFATAEERALTLKKFRQVYDLLKANGMEMQYHNHDFEFMKVEGDKLAIDWLYDEMPGLCPQLDTGWVKYAGADPVEYINKYAKRMHTIHIKDFTAKKLANGPVYDLIGIESCPTKEDNGFRYKPLGAGIQDFDAMFKAIDNTDIECLIVEQDENYDVPSLVNAEISRKYLQTKGL